MSDLARTRAVYDASADRYVDAIGTEINPAIEAPLDRGLLDAFVELVRDDSDALVADVGCGPGRVARYLASRGVRAVGVDISRSMIAAAQRAHPDIPFAVGTVDHLPFQSTSLAGVVCWYSLIHLPPDNLAETFVEVSRTLQLSGYLLLAFQSGAGENARRKDAYGTGLELINYRHSIEAVSNTLESSGFAVHATAQRSAELAHETTPQAFVLARRLPNDSEGRSLLESNGRVL